MNEICQESADENKSSNFLSNAIQLAVTTALEFVDLKKASEVKDHGSHVNIGLNVASVSSNHLPEISLDQVSWHDHCDDCWIVLYDRVYDVTEFLRQHPGGDDILMEYAGRDATLAYRGFGHSAQAWQILQKYLIGILPEKERMDIFKPCEMGVNFELKAISL